MKAAYFKHKGKFLQNNKMAYFYLKFSRFIHILIKGVDYE